MVHYLGGYLWVIVNGNNPLPLRGLPLRQGENMRGCYSFAYGLRQEGI